MDSYLVDSKIETKENTTNTSIVPKKPRATRKRAAKKVAEVMEVKDEVIKVDNDFKQEVESLIVNLSPPNTPELKPLEIPKPLEPIESPSTSDRSPSPKDKVTRKCINKELISNENGDKQYSYTYEIYDEDGKLKSVQKVNNRSQKKFDNKYNPETTIKEPIINAIKLYIHDNQIRIPSLYKRTNLDKILKPLITHIHENVNIKFTQQQLRKLIQKDILEIE